MSFTVAAVIIAWAAIFILALAVAGLLRQIRLLGEGRRLGPDVQLGPAVGAPAPRLEDDASVGDVRLILFASTNCKGCEEVVPAFANGIRTPLERLILYAGEAPKDIPVRTLEDQRATFERWNVSVTPFLAAIDSEKRVVATSAVGSATALERFVKALDRKEE